MKEFAKRLKEMNVGLDISETVHAPQITDSVLTLHLADERQFDARRFEDLRKGLQIEGQTPSEFEKALLGYFNRNITTSHLIGLEKAGQTLTLSILGASVSGSQKGAGGQAHPLPDFIRAIQSLGGSVARAGVREVPGSEGHVLEFALEVPSGHKTLRPKFVRQEIDGKTPESKPVERHVAELVTGFGVLKKIIPRYGGKFEVGIVLNPGSHEGLDELISAERIPAFHDKKFDVEKED